MALAWMLLCELVKVHNVGAPARVKASFSGMPYNPIPLAALSESSN
jgi:hypothetical protein